MRQESLVCLADWKVSAMKIARSSCSNLGGVVGNCHLRSPGAQTCKPQRKRIRFGLVTLMSVASLPEMVKPETHAQATSACRRGTVRGGWEQRARKDRQGTWEIRKGGLLPNGLIECIRSDRLLRKSDAPIVAKKRVRPWSEGALLWIRIQ